MSIMCAHLCVAGAVLRACRNFIVIKIKISFEGVHCCTALYRLPLLLTGCALEWSASPLSCRVLVFERHHSKTHMLITHILSNPVIYHANFAFSSTFQIDCKNQYKIVSKSDNIFMTIVVMINIITILTAAHAGSYSNILDLQTIDLNDGDVRV